MLTEMQKLARLLKLAKMSPMQLHAVSDAYKAHMQAPAMPAARPMVRDPHAFAAHQQMMQNPGQYMPQGQVSSGLELATPPRQYKRASELEKLAACLKDNKSWMPVSRKKKDDTGMAGNEGSKTSELQKLAALLKQSGFLQQGMRQLNTAVNNPGMISRGAGKLYNAAGGGLGGVGAVAKHYAPGAAMVAAPVAAGAHGMSMMGGGQQQPDQQRTASLKTAEPNDLTSFMGAVDPRAAALAGALTAPQGERIPSALGAGIGSYGGRTAGGAIGGTAGEVLARLLKQDPGLGRSMGSSVGSAAGGFFGTDLAMKHVGSKKPEASSKQPRPAPKGSDDWSSPDAPDLPEHFFADMPPDALEAYKAQRPKQDTEKKSSFGPQMRALREKIAVAPLAAAAIPAVAGAAKGLMAGAAGRYVASKAVPMAMNAGMNMMGAGPGAGNKLRAGLAGAATGLIPGSGIASQVAGMAAQPMANKAFGVT